MQKTLKAPILEAFLLSGINGYQFLLDACFVYICTLFVPQNEYDKIFVP
jgi:hypothetical protein